MKTLHLTNCWHPESGGISTFYRETDFRIWIPTHDEHPLPLRIEYQAKGYLRLTFEVVG